MYAAAAKTNTFSIYMSMHGQMTQTHTCMYMCVLIKHMLYKKNISSIKQTKKADQRSEKVAENVVY